MGLSYYKRHRAMVAHPCADGPDLIRWLMAYLGLEMPQASFCAGHDSPIDYLKASYFEPAKDLVVWAPRGGGKTRLGAVATLLDLLHKPGVQVRIIAGSLEQSGKMWEFLQEDAERAAAEMIDRKGSDSRTLQLTNGSRAGVLAQSQKAVRGLRVQKLRCDEVELFEPSVWEAAQMVTQSVKSGFGARGSGVGSNTKKKRRKKTCSSSVAASLSSSDPIPETRSPIPDVISGTIEAMSTWHRPGGLMGGVIESAKAKQISVIRWCILDVLERCPAERDCGSCLLYAECGGLAKTKCDGFFSIDDAIRMKRRTSVEAWESEMLCVRPVTKGRVFPSFDRAIHTGDCSGVGRMSLAMDFGFRNPFVCLWIVTREDGVTEVIDEYVQEQRTVAEHVEFIEGKKWGKVTEVACDPAGSGRNEQTAESNVQLLRRRGYRVKTRHSMIHDGIEMLRAALKTAAGEVRLRINPRCERLIKAMEGYHYGEHGGELPLKDGEHDHLVDALRYHFVNARRGETKGGRCY
jgi:hypothetical protein